MSGTAKTIPLPTTGTTDTTGSASTADSGPGTAPPRTPTFNKLEGQLQDFHVQLGTYLGMMMPSSPVGILTTLNADGIASAWTDLAAQDKRVRETLERLLSGGAWANVIGSYVIGIALPSLALADKLPERFSTMRDGIILVTMRAHPELAAMMGQPNPNGAAPNGNAA